MDGEATIQITYFTSGISWLADYVCIADKAEQQMGFEGFVRVYNNSGEQYENAQIRLVVGTINLVEKIAQLARVPMREVDKLGDERMVGLKLDAAKQMMDEKVADRGFVGGARMAKPKQIIKEGLSEYFIYTVEGT